MDIKTYDWLIARDVRPPDGWSSIVAELLEQIDALVGETQAAVTIRQIKEKLGELRVYYRVEPPELRDRIDPFIRAAEERSRCACTFCGANARMQNAGGWIRPLCDDHLISLKAGMRPDTVAEVARRRAARPEMPLCKPLGEFLDEFYDDPKASMLEEEPSAPIPLEEGAYLAASVEYLCAWYSLPVPFWVNDRKYFLKTASWPPECRSREMETILLAESPTAFRRRFIFTEGRPLRRKNGPRF